MNWEDFFFVWDFIRAYTCKIYPMYSNCTTIATVQLSRLLVQPYYQIGFFPSRRAFVCAIHADELVGTQAFQGAHVDT